MLEDVPFGLVPTARLGRLAGRPAPLHEAGIALLSALYGRDLAAANDLLPAIGFDRLGAERLRTLARDGIQSGFRSHRLTEPAPACCSIEQIPPIGCFHLIGACSSPAAGP